MIAGATRGAGGAALGSHLAKAAGNEQVMTLEGRGLVSEGIREQVAELTRMVSHARTRTPLYHVHADPPADRPWTAEERSEYWHRFEQEFGLEGRPFAAVAHSKEGRDHEHRVYVRVRADGTAIRMDHDHARREKVNRTFEYDRGETLTKGAHNRAIIATLTGERPDVAAAMLAAGLHEGPRPRALLKPEERQQQERTNITKADVASATAQAWRDSGNGAEFMAALVDRGLRLARGDQSPVVVDSTGNTHAVARMLNMAAKAEGTDAPKAQVIRDRLDGLDLPSVDEAKADRQAVGAAPTASAMTEADLGPLTADLAPAAPDRGQPIPAPTEQASTPYPAQPAPAAAEQGATPTPAPSWDARQTPVGGGGGAGSIAAASSDSGGGASLADVGAGPGPAPGPGAHPDERAKWLEKLAAYEDRKAAAWKAWIASWNASQPKAAVPASTGGGQNDSAIQPQAEASAAAVAAIFDRLREDWQHARSAEAIRRAVATFEAEADRIRAAAGIATAPAGHGDDRAASIGHPAHDGHDSPDARAGGPGGDHVGGPHGPEGEGGHKPNRRAAAGPHGDDGEPAQDRGEGRQAVRRAAAQVRLAHGLAAAPEAMDRLRAATMALRPDPLACLSGRERFERLAAEREALYSLYRDDRTNVREQDGQRWKESMGAQREAADRLSIVVRTTPGAGREARGEAWAAVRAERKATATGLKESRPPRATFEEWLGHVARTDPMAGAVLAAMQEQQERKAAAAARIEADRAHIAAVLGTHPHPDPQDRDPVTRADRYAGQLSEGYRERRAAVEQAQAEALVSMRARSVGTRLLASIGISTPEERRAQDAVARALALTDDAKARQPSPADYKSARADGASHAYAAQADTTEWERRPDVARAMEQHRLNDLVDQAAAAGDPAVSRALKAGDPEAARRVIQEREEAERRRQEEQERRMEMQRCPGSPATPGAGGPGTKGTK